MYTATVKKKEFIDGVLLITVAFSDNIKTITDSCKPQDKDGFDHWVKSKLATLNGAVEIDTNYAIDAIIDISNPIVILPEMTPAEVARNTWITKYLKWVKIKATIIDTGIVPITNTKIANMLADLKSTLLPEYIDYI